MKATELIAKLQELVTQLGDEVHVEAQIREEYGFVNRLPIDEVGCATPFPSQPPVIQIRI